MRHKSFNTDLEAISETAIDTVNAGADADMDTDRGSAQQAGDDNFSPENAIKVKVESPGECDTETMKTSMSRTISNNAESESASSQSNDFLRVYDDEGPHGTPSYSRRASSPELPTSGWVTALSKIRLQLSIHSNLDEAVVATEDDGGMDSPRIISLPEPGAAQQGHHAAAKSPRKLTRGSFSGGSCVDSTDSSGSRGLSQPMSAPVGGLTKGAVAASIKNKKLRNFIKFVNQAGKKSEMKDNGTSSGGADATLETFSGEEWLEARRRSQVIEMIDMSSDDLQTPPITHRTTYAELMGLGRLCLKRDPSQCTLRLLRQCTRTV